MPSIDLQNILAGHIKEIPIATNQLILALLKLKNATPNCSYTMLLNWLKMIYGSRWPQENSPTLAAVTKSIECLKTQHFILKKKRDGKAKQVELSHFLQEVHTLPKLGYCKVCHFSPPKEAMVPTVDQSSQKIMDLRKKLYVVTRNTGKQLKRQSVSQVRSVNEWVPLAQPVIRP